MVELSMNHSPRACEEFATHEDELTNSMLEDNMTEGKVIRYSEHGGK